MRIIQNHQFDGRMPVVTYTIECDEDEMDMLGLGLRTHAWAYPETEEEAVELARLIENATS